MHAKGAKDAKERKEKRMAAFAAIKIFLLGDYLDFLDLMDSWIFVRNMDFLILLLDIGSALDIGFRFGFSGIGLVF